MVEPGKFDRAPRAFQAPQGTGEPTWPCPRLCQETGFRLGGRAGPLDCPILGHGDSGRKDTAPLSGAMAKWLEACGLLIHSNSKLRFQVPL